MAGEAQPGLVIWVEEEYGYRDWRWDYPGTVEELVADWNDGLAPTNFFDPSDGNYRGTMTEVDGPVKPRDGYVHVHEASDTYLKVGGQVYPK